MTLKGIIFDLDGTLLYTLEDLFNSVNFALLKCDLKERTLEEVKRFVGNGIKKLIERAIANNKDKFSDCYKYFLEHYSTNSINTTRPYKNVLKGLKELKEKGLKLAILSNKDDSEVKKLSKYFFKDIFDISLGTSSNFDKKPDPKSTLYIIKELNLKKEDVVFIGDSEVDIQTAKNAGIECLSVLWGYKTEEFLIKKGAKKTFCDFDTLKEYLIYCSCI